ncbi:phage portal protein [Kribbella sp. NPDC058245]|uniref:phage portal protein n=1 Tax=Kribbella sp. NPDC058245 TaxID=3346399 RepID=UPI0036E55057
MGLFDRFRKTQAVATWPGTPGDWYGAWRLSADEYQRILGLSPAEMWRTQPYLRTVVTFLARNIAQLGLHAFQRVDDVDRRRIRDGVGQVLARPNRGTTSYELIYGLVADLALYDKAYWLTSSDPEQPLSRLPVGWVTSWGGDALGPELYRVRVNDKGETVDVPAANILEFHGWSPLALAVGSSPVAALREILAEQVQAARYRESVWQRGGKVGSVLSRPAGAPLWSDEARKQFKLDWEARYSGQGPGVGGTPLLEDGMTLNRVDFSAHEMQFIEGARLALNTVASVYHINPTMIGLLDNANYSNVREFRRMLYGDTLGPILAQIEDRLNAFLVPRFDSRPDVYLEFNIEEKLQGSFEEQTQALQSSVGRPWMSANEARALRNMPAVDDGDGLVVPLNVLVGGQASPRDSAPDQPAAASAKPTPAKRNLILLKAAVTDRQADQVAAVLRRFFERQRSADQYGRGGDWDTDRWNRELADDLHRVALSVSGTLGKAEAQALGYSEDDYNPEATVNFLAAVMAQRAENINTTTRDQIEAAILDPEGDPANVYATAVDSRAAGIAVGLATWLAGFASQEAAGQIARVNDVEPSKTWVTGSNARPEHARLDGETVALDGRFSNGLKWPGDADGDADDVAGCNCLLQINL